MKTDKKTLSSMESTLFIKNLLKYRELHKVISTYLIPIIENMDSENRIHAQFGQARTITGRFNSSNPVNLQNIPSRNDLGKKVRSLFIGNHLIVADFNQIELRLLAHFSKSVNLLKAYKENIDIHRQTAQFIFNIEDPSKEQRNIAKVINFSLLYGAGAKTLAQTINNSDSTLKYSEDQAKNIIDLFYKKYPDVNTWKSIEIAKATQCGYIETLLGRKIPIKNLTSEQFTLKYGAQREVISYIIQGSAADIMKKSLIDISNYSADIKIVSAIHDEFLIEDGSTHILKIITKLMENSVSLEVPLKVEASIVKNWGEK